MSEEEKELQEIQEPEIELDDEGNPIEEKVTPEPLEDTRVLEHLKAQGIELKGLDDIKNSQASYKGLQTKFNALNSQLETLRKNPKFAEFLQDSYSGKQPDKSIDGLPESLRNKTPQDMEALEKVMNHFMKPQMTNLEERVNSIIIGQLFKHFNPESSEHEEKMVELMKARGITDRSLDTLNWIYNQVKGDGKPASPLVDGKEPKPKTIIRQIGISPKVSERTSKVNTAKKHTDEYWRRRIDNGEIDEDEE